MFTLGFLYTLKKSNMKEHHKRMIILGVVIVGVGAGLYWYWKNQQPAATVAAAPATPAKTS